jgi:hypothetical protein
LNILFLIRASLTGVLKPRKSVIWGTRAAELQSAAFPLPCRLTPSLAAFAPVQSAATTSERSLSYRRSNTLQITAALALLLLVVLSVGLGGSSHVVR